MAKNKKKKILKAAERIVKNRRFHEITMDEIATAAGVGKGTIYRYFENKEDLFFQLASGGMDELCDRLRAAADKKLLFRERLLSMCTEISQFYRRRFALIKVITDEDHRQRRRREMGKQWRHVRHGIYEVIREALADGVSAGEIRDDVSLENQAVLLMGMLRSRGMSLRHNPESSFELADVVDFFLEGARGPSRGGA